MVGTSATVPVARKAASTSRSSLKRWMICTSGAPFQPIAHRFMGQIEAMP
jgi:hypothetical protein